MHQPLDDHIQVDMVMTPGSIDLSLYFKFEDDQIIGLNGSCANDLLRIETSEWMTLADATLERFETAGSDQYTLTFTGVYITEKQDMLIIDQDFYLNKIEQIPSEAEFSKFAPMGMKIAWLANTRPDLAFEISQKAQVTRNIFEQDSSKHHKRLNKAIRYEYDNRTSIYIPNST